ncbi:MAG: hypothetical protein AB7I18_10630 [Candidatus Berkiella sp.]
MFTLKSEPQDKLSILEQGFRLYRQTFWLALPYSLLGAFFIFSPVLLIPLKPAFSPLITSMLFFGLLGFVLLSALLFRLHCFIDDLPLTFLGSLAHAMTKLIPLLLLGVLYALMVISGTLFLIIPGIILAVSLMFSFILFLTGNQNVLQTLINSHRLVWGHWWHTLFVTSFPLLLDLAVSIAIFLGLLAAFIHHYFSFAVLYLAVCLLNILIQALFLPLVFCIALVLLNDLRIRQGGPLPRW